MTTFAVTVDPMDLVGSDVLVVVGRRGRLLDEDTRELVPLEEATWRAMLERARASDGPAVTGTWMGTQHVAAVVLPEVCSRSNPPARTWGLAAALRSVLPPSGRVGVVLAVTDASHALPTCLAVARALPGYTRKTAPEAHRELVACVLGPLGVVDDRRVPGAVEGVRLAMRLAEMPASELDVPAFVAEARAVAVAGGLGFEVIDGVGLVEGGFGGLVGVGKAAEAGPALVRLTWDPPRPRGTVAWVGKGIVYDTGGLSLKSKEHMPGMKGDMGGAAGVLGAVLAAARCAFPLRVEAILCLAENAIGPKALRPDDVLRLHSGRTVEVNNTDAEGRLVVADGVSWAARTLAPDLVVDLATLTGAALITSGKAHAAVYTNDLAVEHAAVAAGLRAGEPVHPLLYAPELHRAEFRSEVADMKNSVKDRNNAQSSCAACFIEGHLPTPAPRWLHVDMAGPGWAEGDRGSGFGVGLLLELGLGPTASGRD